MFLRFTVAIAFPPDAMGLSEVYPTNAIKEFETIPDYMQPLVDNGTIVIVQQPSPPPPEDILDNTLPPEGGTQSAGTKGKKVAPKIQGC